MNKKPAIDKNIKIEEIVTYYPEVIELLVIEYGFHCIGCHFSSFETLEEGAQVHGITGEDLKKLIEELKAIANKAITNNEDR
jgi:hybrid cluster-associated redox disulfide protein